VNIFSKVQKRRKKQKKIVESKRKITKEET
jgi:hypothetical protein